VREYQLNNGLKVILCKDSRKPEIMGAVHVNVGSINDPEDATGTAHLLEHLMFKGTDKIGTINWEEEKVFLDSISYYYDKLHDARNKKERKTIQEKINVLSKAAAEYAIPNEFGTILSKMGCTEVNALTGKENTIYLNAFPSNQLDNWLAVYSERFRYPVFRLFNSELETIYEEKNTHDGGAINALMYNAMKEIYGNHPYGKPTLGYADHLKYPRISKIQDFFNTYYVANNMTIILVGDIEYDNTIQSIETYFGSLPYGEIPAQKEYNIPIIKNKTIVESAETPIKIGMLGYKTVPVGHEDNLIINCISEILINHAGTGLIDELMIDNKIHSASCKNAAEKQYGYFSILYIPKANNHAFDIAEHLITKQINSLIEGSFSDELFEAVKRSYLMNQSVAIEDYSNIFQLITLYLLRGRSWHDYYSDLERVESLTKEDVINTAAKYFGKDYLSYRSNPGKSKNDIVSKFNFEPNTAQNTVAQSEFAKIIDSKPIKQIKSQVIDFEKDIVINKTNPDFPIYSVNNPYNDIFTLAICYNYGNYYNKHLSYAFNYINIQGTTDIPFKEFSLQMQMLGAAVNTIVFDDKTIIYVSGHDKDFNKIISLCQKKFFDTGNDEKLLNNVMYAHFNNLRMMMSNADDCSKAVFQYATYGEDSKYLRMPSLYDTYYYKGDMLINSAREVFKYNGHVTYTGNIDSQDVYTTLYDNNFINSYEYKKYNGEKTNSKLIPVQKEFDENAIYYIKGSKKLQSSSIHFYVPGIQMTQHDKNKILSTCFNQYFGNDIYSILFNEIREVKALGYSVNSTYYYDGLDRAPGYLHIGLDTNSDKTLEGIEAIHSLIKNMPQDKEKYHTAKASILAARRGSYHGFREIPSYVHSLEVLGYDKDPIEDLLLEI
ncbi:insulinase family protein, partial [Bacteroidales bacterium OttesenSCG-928-K03]|nr:insulinase family protein [Bacteroidales bacterium OttesenSCG-928-K03]